jgi:hypothetical protein
VEGGQFSGAEGGRHLTETATPNHRGIVEVSFNQHAPLHSHRLAMSPFSGGPSSI